MLLACLSLPVVGQVTSSPGPADALAYVQTLKKLTDVMVGDVTGPCAAARYYAYANLAAYEIV
ncbi:MAG TPA: phosphatidic acid phosphatase, partial [Cytophagales bacterium]